MGDTIELPTMWDIRHADPIAPGKIVVAMFNSAGMQYYVFERELFLEFVRQVDIMAAQIRAGVV